MTTNCGNPIDSAETVLYRDVRPVQKYSDQPILHEYMTMLENGFVPKTDAEWDRLLAALAKEKAEYEAK